MRVKKLKQQYSFWIMVGIIVIWPILNSFLGIDTVDTGYYLYQYANPLSDYGVYTTFFATLIGAVWLKIFGFLGLWGLNLLEIFLEWILCLIVYYTFRDIFGKRVTLAGCTLTMIIISTYVNIFNYHQLNMFLCTTMLCMMYQGLQKERFSFFLLSGMAGMLAVFTRMPSILSLICIVCIFYWGIFIKKTWKKSFQYAGGFLLGYLIMAGVIAIGLQCIGRLWIVIGEVFRLNDLGKNGGAAYGTNSMVLNLIKDSFNAVCAFLLFAVCVFIVLLLSQWKSKNSSIMRKVVWFLGVLCTIPIVWMAVYKVGRAPVFVQLTSYNWFVYGCCFTVAIFCIFYGMFSKKEEAGWNGLLMLMSIALILLCCVGSAARLKHTILGIWIVVPFLLNEIKLYYKKEKKLYLGFGKTRKRIRLKAIKETDLYIGVIAAITMFIFVAGTNNFDSVNRLELTASVDSNKLRGLKTTNRQAEAMNGVLKVLEQKKKEDKPLMVLGNAVIFYYLTDMDSYVKPWVSGTSYTANEYADHLYKETTMNYKKLPVIVWGKTNAYEGFSEEKYDELLKREEKSTHDGKKAIAQQFMDEHGYVSIFENDYFKIYDCNAEETE